MQYDMRPDRTGWTVFDVTTDKPVVLDDLVLVGLDSDAAHQLVSLLHRPVTAYRARTTQYPRVRAPQQGAPQSEP